MKQIFLSFSILTAILASCNNSNGPDVDASIMPPKDSAKQDLSSNIQVNNGNTAMPANVVTPSTGNTVMPMPVPNTGQPQIVMPQSQNVQKIVPTQVTAPGMNPPHGQPGHRCDIAVGAPLNSPKGNTTPTQVAAPTTQAPATIKAPTTTAPGMNPPHGQPGHRCDIAVGAPLNSQPTTITQTGKQAPVTVQPVKDNGAKQNITPVQIEPKKVQEATNPEGKKEQPELKEAKEEKKN